MYTALVLDEASKQKLLSAVPVDPNEFDEVVAHHMTINMGPCQMPTELGKPYTMQVVAIGKSEFVLAVQVESECASNNAIKHITVAVNRAKGGKPFMSNKITDWQPFSGPTLKGVVEECQ
jgi:hypothetical protein